MPVQNPERVVTKQDLKDFYDAIYPYLGGGASFEELIAHVEADATSASKAYEIGDQLILSGVLYTATAAISIGDPLTVGTNIAASDDITTQIADIDITTDATPTKNSTHAVQSGGVYSSEKAIREIVAPVEENATSASQAYAIGEYLILNGILYKAKTAISSTDALVVGTNIELADDVETQIASKANTADLGTAAAKDSTDAVAQSSTDLVESGAVYGALASKADAPTIKTATLAANATTVSFTGMPTTGNNIISFYIDGGANYTAINTATSGQVTLTYDAESSARTVYCEIEEVS